MKKTKRACATGVALRRVFTVMVALFLVFRFNACSNSGGGGGIGDGTGGKGKGKDYESGGKYYNEEEGRAYEVGDIITGGNGMIFYYSEKGFTMTDTGDTAHFLEVSVHDLTIFQNRPWLFFPSSGNPQLSGIPRSDSFVEGTQAAIGTGRKNTALMRDVAEIGSNDAFSVVISILQQLDQMNEDVLESNYGGGKDDWFVPSKDELNELAKFIKSRQNFEELFPTIVIGDSVFIWTSTQGNAGVYVQAVTNGDSTESLQIGTGVNGNAFLRPIRAF